MSKIVDLYSLTGRKSTITIRLEMTGRHIQEEVARLMNEDFYFLTVIINGRILMNLDIAFTPISEWNKEELKGVHYVYNLGGPNPHKKAVLEMCKLSEEELKKIDLQKIKLLLDNSKQHIECPICEEICVNRITTCCYQWACMTCWSKIEQQCPYCRRNKNIL